MVNYRRLFRRAASALAIKTGPSNPIVQAMMRVRCRPLALKFEGDHLDVSKDNRTIRLAAKHFPYAYDMVEHFELFFNQLVPENGGAGLLVDLSGPRLQRYKNGLEFELSSFPEELEAIAEYFHWYEPKPDDLILDIGAYCGVTAYHLSKRVPEGKVYSFEPDPINFRLLTRNIERHGLKNVTPLPFGISDKTEEAAIFLSEGTMGSRLEKDSTRMTVGDAQRIQTLTLADACARYGVPDFVKVDIEGSEIQMLAAAVPFLRSNPLRFAVDTNHWIDGKLTASAVEEIFRSCGYETESDDRVGFMTTWAVRRDRLAVQAA
jgi:FkbM family methyltransferase